MVQAATQGGALVERLRMAAPDLCGRLTPDTPLGPGTWFRVGGNAEALFRPADEEDLAYFLAHLPDDVPVTIIGMASNLLVRDGGVPGVTIRLGGPFAAISVTGDMIDAGAGALDLNVALTAQQAGLAGLEFLSGIPGTIGGAVRMNGGAYGAETVDVILSADGVDRTGARHTWTRDELGLTYRHCAVADDVIFTRARFQGRPDAPEAVKARIDAIQRTRADSQPVRSRTGGSTFANPDGYKAWQLIDAAGCRGLTIGGAQISEKHCNFLLNLGDATADDIESLGEEVRRRVQAQSGIDLRWEIRRIGLSRSDGGAS
jgi:UDP-N-acetylmuramate dehydrogenase